MVLLEYLSYIVRLSIMIFTFCYDIDDRRDRNVAAKRTREHLKKTGVFFPQGSESGHEV